MRLHAPSNPLSQALAMLHTRHRKQLLMATSLLSRFVHPSLAWRPAAKNPPVAGDLAYTINEDEPLIVTAANGLLSNINAADGDVLAVKSYTQPAHGRLAVNDSDGSFVYDPDADYNGQDTFTYSVSNGAATSTASVSITISEPAPLLLNMPAELGAPSAAMQGLLCRGTRKASQQPVATHYPQPVHLLTTF
jgi:hypothetical protein